MTVACPLCKCPSLSSDPVHPSLSVYLLVSLATRDVVICHCHHDGYCKVLLPQENLQGSCCHRNELSGPSILSSHLQQLTGTKAWVAGEVTLLPDHRELDS